MYLYGYGLVNYDDVVIVDSLGHDSKVTASATFQQVGGPVPVALQTFTRLGGNATFFGTVGEDTQGDYIQKRLRDSLSQSLVLTMPKGCTSRSIVILETNGCRTIVNVPASNNGIVDITAFVATFRPGGILHVDGRDLETTLKLCAAAKSSGMFVSIDLGTMRPGREAILSLCDIILASKGGSAGLTPNCPEDVDRQLTIMRQFGASVVGVTLAERGVIIGDQVNTYHLPAFNVQNVVDTNGAGDCFHGAFLYAYSHLGGTLEEITKFAQASAAVKISTLGNDAGLPKLSKVLTYLGA